MLKLMSVVALFLSFQNITLAVEYLYIENTDLSKLPLKQRVAAHKKMSAILVELEKEEKFPPYKPSKLSKVDFYRFLSNLLVDGAIANESSNMCLFGGWLSQRQGRCGVPWSSSATAIASSRETLAYDSKTYCGSSGLFRCNPLVFGPGIDTANLPGEVSERFPHLNGQNNSDSPYSSGICVDISDGYNGLSAKCQEASALLDNYRERPWRETFLNGENAAQFRALQTSIAEKCRESEEARGRLNADGMCSGLENMLGLTAAAVQAGKISDINIEDLFPQCSDMTPNALPTCEAPNQPGLENLELALSELRNDSNCRFQGLEVMDSATRNRFRSNNLAEARANTCQINFSGRLPEKGISSDTGLSIFLRGLNMRSLGELKISIDGNTSKNDILSQLTTGDNLKRYQEMCQNSACPRSEAEGLGALYNALEEVKGRENCPIPVAYALDSETDSSEDFQAPSCGLSIQGSINIDGLRESPSNVIIRLRKPDQDIPTRFSLNLTNRTTQKEIMEQLNQDSRLDDFCIGAKTEERTSITTAKERLGITPTQFVAQSQEQLLTTIGRYFDENNIEGVNVRLDETGNLSISPLDEVTKNQLINYIDINVTGYDIRNLSYSGDTIIVSSLPPARMEYLTQGLERPLTDGETAALSELVSDPNARFLNLTAGDGGGLTFTVAGGNGPSQEIVSNYFERSVVVEKINGNSVYNISKATERNTVAAPDFTIEDVVTPDPNAIRNDIISGPPAFTLEDVLMNSPLAEGETVDALPVTDRRRTTDLRFPASDRVEALAESILVTDPETGRSISIEDVNGFGGNIKPYLISVANGHPVTAINVDANHRYSFTVESNSLPIPEGTTFRGQGGDFKVVLESSANGSYRYRISPF